MAVISVIIPAYNAEKTIRETIESVLNQTFKNFELIVVNDGSIDSTPDIVSRIKDPRIKVFSYPNSGVSASCNKGFTQSSGEFVSFLDADDLWMPDKLEAQLRALKENSQAAVAYSLTDYIDESGEFLSHGAHVAAEGNVLPKLLEFNFLESGSNSLIRQNAFKEIGGFNEGLSLAQEWDLHLRLADRFDFVCVPLAQILYRQTSKGSSSKNILKLEKESLTVIESAFDKAPESLKYLKKRSLAYSYWYLAYKTFKVRLGRAGYMKAARWLWLSVKNKPFLSFEKTLSSLSLFLRVICGFLLPRKWSDFVFDRIDRMKRLFFTWLYKAKGNDKK